MSRPLIGLTGERIHGRDMPGGLAVQRDFPADLFWSNYADAVIEAGGLPVLLPQNVPINEVVARLDGLLMTGGTDIEPTRYHAEPDPALLAVEPARDEFELALLTASTQRGLPTLGICRGIQILNVHGGGTLHQHVPVHTNLDGPADEEHHVVNLASGSTLHDLYGATRQVNSLHHQGLDKLADGFIATARGFDGLVEGIEHEHLPIVAVQWHPEMMKTRPTDPIFSWLIAQAAA